MRRLCLLVLFSLANLLLNHTALAEPYLIHKDGAMVLDKATGLVWMRCALGQKWNGQTCAGKSGEYTYDQALAAAKSFNDAGGLGGATDWVVPTIRQLAGLRFCSVGFTQKTVDMHDGGTPLGEACQHENQNRTINPVVFPALIDPIVWSASPCVDNTGCGWYVRFNGGYVGFNGGHDGVFKLRGAVRLVRDRQLSGDDATLEFVNEAPAAELLWQEAEEKRKAVAAAKAARLQQLIAQGAETMYLEANKARRNSSVENNGDSLSAIEIYMKLIQNFPGNDYSYKAFEELAQELQAKNSLSPGLSSGNAACRTSANQCEVKCSDGSTNKICTRPCLRICN